MDEQDFVALGDILEDHDTFKVYEDHYKDIGAADEGFAEDRTAEGVNVLEERITVISEMLVCILSGLGKVDFSVVKLICAALVTTGKPTPIDNHVLDFDGAVDRA